MHRTAAALVSAVLAWSPSLHAGRRSVSPADIAALTRRIPQRPSGALSGSRFADSLAGLDAADRERAILDAVVGGNIPSFLEHLVPVDLTYRAAGRTIEATVFVMPDYLSIGTDADFLRIPMNLSTATAVADALGFMLPTRKIVNAIYEQSGHHFAPEPLPAGPRMTSTDYYRTHNTLIERQARAAGVALGTLVSGHKKDVVLTNLLSREPARIAIYGWHRLTGVPIQPLSTVHGACYADYSHGIRLVADMAWEDGALRPLHDLLRDASVAPALSDEGVLRVASAPPACGLRPRAVD